jgi:hypothetical protein
VLNLQAFAAPDWRPSSADSVCSQRAIPSEHVPDSGAIGAVGCFAKDSVVKEQEEEALALVAFCNFC